MIRSFYTDIYIPILSPHCACTNNEANRLGVITEAGNLVRIWNNSSFTINSSSHVRFNLLVNHSTSAVTCGSHVIVLLPEWPYQYYCLSDHLSNILNLLLKMCIDLKFDTWMRPVKQTWLFYFYSGCSEFQNDSYLGLLALSENLS